MLTPPKSDPTVAPDAPPGRFTLRAIVLAVVFSLLGVAWAMQVSLIQQSVYIGGSVPPIPTVTVLLLLLALNPLLRKRGFTQAEVLMIALFVSVVTAVTDPNCILPYFYAFLVIARQSPGSEQFTSFTKSIPPWYAPQDEAALKGFVEGHAPIPWGVWVVPLLGWGMFFCALWVTTLALLRLFRDRWIAHERLQFPIVDLMVQLTPGTEKRSFFRSPFLWAGIGVSAVLNLLNIASAYVPGVPAPGRFIDVAPAFPTPPWNALNPCWISLRPEIFGLGYLMNTDVLLTAWLSYLVMRLCSVGATAMGYEVQSGYYDYQEIATGAYLGILGVLIWMGRGPVGGLGQQAWEALKWVPKDSPRAAANRRNRICVTVALMGFLYQLWWCALAGMAWWIGSLYIGLMVAFALVYARVRAETGAPIWYVFPFWQQQKMLLNVFGTTALGADGGTSLAALALFGFLARGTFPQLAAFHIEGMEIANRTRVRSKSLYACLLTALPLGLAVGMLTVLVLCYRYGFYSVDGGAGEGGFRVIMATQQYRELVQWRTHTQGPNFPLIFHTLLGAGLALGMGSLRGAFPGFPLHPLGFAMAASYGFHLWAPFFAVWLCKLLILKAGGSKLYRRFVPFFLGIVIGHYLTVGLIWGAISLWIPELTRKYIVHFA